jgi:hypothetical protein
MISHPEISQSASIDMRHARLRDKDFASGILATMRARRGVLNDLDQRSNMRRTVNSTGILYGYLTYPPSTSLHRSTGNATSKTDSKAMHHSSRRLALVCACYRQVIGHTKLGHELLLYPVWIPQYQALFKNDILSGVFLKGKRKYIRYCHPVLVKLG